MSNHLHMLIRINDPEDTPKFVAYVKRETAHAINRLLNRKRHTVWCEGYDDPKILTAQDVIRYIVYIYLNPVAARLVASIKDYPGVSSWEMYTKSCVACSYKWIRRSSIIPLTSNEMSYAEQRKYINALIDNSNTEHSFTLEPNAWMESFSETCNADSKVVNTEILAEIRAQEKLLLQRGPVVGVEVLTAEPINKKHIPKKHGLRMLCLCSNKALRIAFITWFKILQKEARQVYLAWKLGDFTAKLPPGFFAPGGHLLCNLIGMPTTVLS